MLDFNNRKNEKTLNKIWRDEKKFIQKLTGCENIETKSEK